MFRVGLVDQQDIDTARVRVRFPDRDQMISFWLPIAVRGAQNDKDYWMPEIGEQVVCLMDQHDEDGCVLGCLNSTLDAPPAGMTADKRHLAVKDGASFEYDRSAHSLAVSLPANATMRVSANGAVIEIDTEGDVNISSTGNIKLAGGGPGVARLGDEVTCPAGAGVITGASSKVQAG